MLKIFAKYGTDEKVAMFCHPRQEIRPIQISLETLFGGDWLLVDEVKTSCEILKFNDGQIYKGFDSSKSFDFRYSKAIKKFGIER